MPHFKFNLEGVLRHRSHVERERQRDLAQSQSQMRLVQEEMSRIQQAVQEAVADLRGYRLVGALDVPMLAAQRRFITAMQHKAMQVGQRIQLSSRQVDERRAALVVAAKERKAIEKIREKQYGLFLADLAAREHRELDEIGMQLQNRYLAAVESAGDSRGES
jgi:flagellar protein FliJ